MIGDVKYVLTRLVESGWEQIRSFKINNGYLIYGERGCFFVECEIFDGSAVDCALVHLDSGQLVDLSFEEFDALIQKSRKELGRFWAAQRGRFAELSESIRAVSEAEYVERYVPKLARAGWLVRTARLANGGYEIAAFKDSWRYHVELKTSPGGGVLPLIAEHEEGRRLGVPLYRWEELIGQGLDAFDEYWEAHAAEASKQEEG